MVQDDRREFQRLKLPRPIMALADGHDALLLDVGVAGAFVEHHGQIEPGSEFRLTFRWQGEELEFLCEAVRSQIVRPSADKQAVIVHTGVRFIDSSDATKRHLQEMMATFVGRVLAAQRANASGDHQSEALLGMIGDARRSRSRGYLRYQLQHGTWTREATSSSKQPVNGFTVAAFEDEEELETLCRAYENADEEGRGLIRLVAELSALEAKR